MEETPRVDDIVPTFLALYKYILIEFYVLKALPVNSLFSAIFIVY